MGKEEDYMMSFDTVCILRRGRGVTIKAIR